MTQYNKMVQRVQWDNQSGFSQHDAGELNPNPGRADAKRRRVSKYPDVEKKLVDYIHHRKLLLQHDKVGLSFAILQQRALRFADLLCVPPNTFEASPVTEPIHSKGCGYGL